MKKLLRILKKIIKGNRGIISKEYIAKFLPSDPVILEAGADTGSDTVEMNKLWPDSIIYAFEPIPVSFLKLVDLTKNYKNIHCFNLALSNKNGKDLMNLSNTLSSSSLLKPKEHLNQHPEITFEKKIEIDTTTIDQWAIKNKISKIDFMWLDLQGIELEVLKSSESILKNVKVIYTEVSLIENYEGTALYEELKDFLISRGFRVDKEELPWQDMGNVLFVRE